ncbi:MAG TPA: acyltransferase [Pseudonocardiaceae bacterium]
MASTGSAAADPWWRRSRWHRDTDGFATVRMLAAAAVVVEHSVPLSKSGPSFIPERLHTNLGVIAVSVFMAISGYYVTQSWDRDPSWWRYLTRRILRIFPPLAAVILVCTYVLGVVVTTLPRHEYLHHPLTSNYVWHNLILYPVTYNLPGVFTRNVYGPAVNGSLWSLPVEVLGYLLVVVLGVVGAIKFRPLAVVAAIGSSVLLQRFMTKQVRIGTPILGIPTHALLLFLPMFLFGMAAYLYRDKVRFTWTGIALCLGVEVIMFGSPLVEVTRGVTVTYIALALGTLLPRALILPALIAPASYGMYLWGFPVEQTIMYFGPRSQWSLLGMALPITLVLALVSWYLIEKPGMRLRGLIFRLGRRPRSARPAATAREVAAAEPVLPWPLPDLAAGSTASNGNTASSASNGGTPRASRTP